MSIETFEYLSLTVGIGGLVLYMVFVMYKLAQASGAGRFGTVTIFMTLGMGIVGFAEKSLIQLVIQVWMAADPRSRLSLVGCAR